MSCVTKNIDAFCSNFIGINMNLSGATGPTLECQILGQPDYTINHENILSGVVKRLKDSGIPIKGEWELLSASTSRSGSGVVTSVRMIDKIWREQNSTTIGVNYESGGDIMLGKEYYHIGGIPITTHVNPGEAIVSADTLLSWYRPLNTGQAYITAGGSIATKPSNMTAKEFLASFSPGLPDPRVEFGNFYYNPQQLIEAINDRFGIKIKGADGMYGLFNNSGSVFQVLNSLGNMFGKVYVANSFWQPQFIDLTGDTGKASVLQANGIEIPKSAVSSNIEIDYSSGFTWNATKITKVPGREREEPNDSNDGSDSGAAIEKFHSKSKHLLGSSSDCGYVNIENAYGSWETTDYAWAVIRNSSWAQEYGRSIAIKNNGTRAGADADIWFNNLYGVSGYTFYTDIAGYDSEDFIALAASSMGASSAESSFGELGSGIQYMQKYFENYNRFYYSRTFPNERDSRENNRLPFSGPITASGTNDFDMYGNSTSGSAFSNFGSQLTNLGQKEWFVEPAGAQISFVSGDLGWQQSPFAGANPNNIDGASIADFLYETNRASLDNYNPQYVDQGVLLVDYGPNPLPQLQLPEFPEGLQALVDESPSVQTNSNQPAFGGIAGIKLNELKSVGTGWMSEVAAALVLPERVSPKAGFFGFKSVTPSGVGHRIADGSRYGTDVRDANLDEDDQRAVINLEPRVFRKLHQENCEPPLQNANSASLAFNLNKSQINHKVNYGWTTGKDIPGYKTEEALIKVITEEGSVERIAYRDICNNGFAVPYVEKIGFTLINEMLEDFDLKYLESLTINVVDGKLTANYKFSEKNMLPDFKGMAAMKVKLQNML